MKFVEIEITRATGLTLDWAVAKAMGELDAVVVFGDNIVTSAVAIMTGLVPSLMNMRTGTPWEPSTDWGLVGHLIKTEGITVGPWDTSPFMAHYGLSESVSGKNPRMVAPSPNVAVMRAFAYRHLGGKIMVPEMLII